LPTWQIDVLRKAIFYQRPLKSQKGLIGKCPFETNKSRCAVSHPLFEEFRMLCFLNNIKIKTPTDEKLRVLNNEERPELDASIMDGKTLNAGAVAGVKHIKNPINLAKEVLENSKHVLLAGEGAEHFAKEQGFKMMPESYFVIEERLNEVRKMKSEDKENVLTSYYDNKLNAPKMGTVGCVALDKNGNLAAGTSTGGLTNKKFGRIGDSPIIGAGTYANNQTCAVSCTGTGEFYIRGVVAYDMSALMEYKNYSVDEAAKEIIHKKQPELGGTGGIIAMDKNGNVSMEFNTPGMFRAKMDDKGNLEVKIFKD